MAKDKGVPTVSKCEVRFGLCAGTFFVFLLKQPLSFTLPKELTRVSAVFHSTLSTDSDENAIKIDCTKSINKPARGQNVLKMASSPDKSPAAPAPRTPFIDWRALALRVLPPWMGLGLLVGIWALVSMGTASSIPGRWKLNTAVGVQRVPQDYMNVARVLNL